MKKPYPYLSEVNNTFV